MKKLVTAACMAVCAASLASAVEVKASTVMNAKVMGQDANERKDFYLFQLDDRNQKDEDSLLFEINGERAGAYFRGWYKYRGDNIEYQDWNKSFAHKEGTDSPEDNIFRMRNTRLWFKPVNMLKITIGDVASTTYCERIRWWKAQTGAKGYKGDSFSNNATVNGRPGVLFTLTPIDGLEANVAFEAGSKDNSYDGSWWHGKRNDDGTYNYKAYGASVKYQITDTVSAAVAWRDEGRGAQKILALGADFGNWGTPYYGFLNARLNFNKGYSAIDDAGTFDVYGEDVKLRGIVLDNYFKYKMDQLTIEVAFPVTIRLNNWEDGDKSMVNKYGTATKMADDPSYMTFDSRISYEQDWGTPYLEICDNDSWAPIVFNSDMGDLFGIVIQPGCKFNIENCSINVGFKNEITKGKDHYYGWSIPVEMRVNF